MSESTMKKKAEILYEVKAQRGPTLRCKVDWIISYDRFYADNG